MHLSKLWKVYVHVLLLTELILAVSQIRMQNLLQRDYYKIIISDYLAKVDQSDHRKITIILDKKVCLSQSVRLIRKPLEAQNLTIDSKQFQKL